MFADYSLSDMWMETRKLFGMYLKRRMWLPMPIDRPEKPPQGQQ